MCIQFKCCHNFYIGIKSWRPLASEAKLGHDINHKYVILS